MATARDTLLSELSKLLSGEYTQRAQSSILAVLDQFRIQSKSGLSTKTGTAREILCDQLLKVWAQMPSVELSHELLSAISGYRMQLKPGASLKSDSKVKSRKLAKKIKLGVQPVAGGPQKRQRLRGECPKCHSMGVVLARSYSGDEYYSCIYCGYQNYRKSVDLEYDLPLAAELLNRRFDEKASSSKR